jgi:hypothetical protein
LEFGFELANPVVEHAAVKFDLFLTRAATQSDATLLSLKVRPTPHKPSGLVFHLGQFDLQLPLMTARSLPEDLKDQTNALDDPNAPQLLEIALLDGGQGVIEQDMIDRLGLQAQPDLLSLAAANKISRVGSRALHHLPTDHRHCSRTGQRSQFVQRAIVTL